MAGDVCPFEHLLVFPDRPLGIDEVLTRFRIPGLAVAIIEDGDVVETAGFGVQRRGGPPFTPGTVSQAGSVSKLVTAVAVLSMAAEGIVGLDDEVMDRLKRWRPPASFEGVTLRRLLSHTAGVGVHGFLGYHQDAALPDLVEVLDGRGRANNAPVRVEVAPGSTFRYSGGAYCVVQLLIEDITNEPFERVVDELVFKPCAMSSSGFSQTSARKATTGVAVGHHSSGAPVDGGWFHFRELAAAGLWTTADDLAALTAAIQNSACGRGPLPASVVTEMLIPQVGGHGTGVMLAGEGPARRFGHSGANVGYIANVVAGCDHEFGAVVMCNSDLGLSIAPALHESIGHSRGWPWPQSPPESIAAEW